MRHFYCLLSVFLVACARSPSIELPSATAVEVAEMIAPREIERGERIRAGSVEAPVSSISGSYSTGVLTGSTLILASDGTYEENAWNCLGDSGTTFGSWKTDDGLIALRPLGSEIAWRQLTLVRFKKGIALAYPNDDLIVTTADLLMDNRVFWRNPQ